MKAEETCKSTTRGRPRYNIVRERERALGSTRAVGMPLELKRIIMIHKRKNWAKMYTSWARGKGYYAWSRKWEERRSDSYYRPYLDAEHAMILCGQLAPQKRYDKGGAPMHKPTWYDEFFWFRKYCEEVIATESKLIVRWGRVGQKPNPESIYRTAISTLVARKMLNPKGCNPTYLPPPIAIAQAWFLLFGEREKSDSIRKRMQTVGRFCANFHQEVGFKGIRKDKSLCNLSKPILRKYPLPVDD